MEGVFAGICRQYDRAEELLEEVLPYAHWGCASVIETQEGIVVTMLWLQVTGRQGDRMQSDYGHGRLQAPGRCWSGFCGCWYVYECAGLSVAQ